MMRWLLIALLCTWSMLAQATTTASLSRNQMAIGESVELLIATDQLRPPDTSALAGQFRVRNAGTERSIRYANGNLVVDLRYRLLLEPLQPGLQTIPSLVVGSDRTQPLQLQVGGSAAAPGGSSAGAPAQQQAVSGQGEVFVQTHIDDMQPYVQQSVGVVVRLYYATQLIDGSLEQDPAQGASLTKVGDDIQNSAMVGGRPYQVIERRYVLVPDRSGPLVLPAARFRGQGAGGFFDDMFGDGRKPLSAQGQAQTLQVQTIPAAAPQPWLPLQALKIEVAAKPNSATAGEAALVTLRMDADGATAAQLPELALQASNGALVYPEQPEVQESSVDGRPRTRMTRRFSVVPAQAGALTLTPAPIDWWNTATRQPGRAEAASFVLNVAPGQGAFATPTNPSTSAATGTETTAPWYRRSAGWIAILAVLLLAWLGTLAWALRRRRDAASPAPATAGTAAAKQPEPAPHALKDALARGQFAEIAQALQRSATPPAADLETLKSRLADQPQVNAVDLLQAMLWGSGGRNGAEVLQALRAAFHDGPRWRQTEAKTGQSLLPPLYPDH